MKKLNRILVFTILLFAGMVVLSCTDEDEGIAPVDPSANPDLPSANIIVDEGSVGLVIDTRQIARKGYKPFKAIVTFSGSFSSLSGEVLINQNTNVGTLKISSEDLTDEVIDQLAKGVEITILILNETSEELASYSDEVNVNASNQLLPIETDLPGIYPPISIDENTPYLIQAITGDPAAGNGLFRIYQDPTFEEDIDAIFLDDEAPEIVFIETKKETYLFYFEEINDSVFHIKMQVEGYDNPFYLRMSGPGYFYSYYVTDPAYIDNDYYKFVLKRDDNGNIKIRPLSGNPLDLRTTRYTTQLHYSDSPEDYLPVRILAANISWTVEDRGTEFNNPVLPPAKLDFAFSSVLRNCSGATLTERVGKLESQTRSYTVGSEESLELYSSQEETIEVTAGLETQANLFGQSVTASLEVSAGYNYTTSQTTTSTNTWSETVEETVEISRIRDVEIPPFTAVEVFDAVQTLENVKLPFVQILRVRGKYNGTDPLSGYEITSQLFANQFGGVVTQVEDNYVEITVRGTATIAKFFEVESQVNELEGGCE